LPTPRDSTQAATSAGHRHKPAAIVSPQNRCASEDTAASDRFATIAITSSLSMTWPAWLEPSDALSTTRPLAQHVAHRSASKLVLVAKRHCQTVAVEPLEMTGLERQQHSARNGHWTPWVPGGLKAALLSIWG
jgi:hypothetical protein